MARLKHASTGVIVEVDDDLVLGSEWGPVDSGSPRSGSLDSSWKVADLKAYADENSIDLADATKKDDILAAINAGQE